LIRQKQNAGVDLNRQRQRPVSLRIFKAEDLQM
jgi:hypothetical protein